MINPDTRVDQFGQRSEADQAAFFHAVLAATREAQRRVPPMRVSLQVARCRIDLMFAGQRLHEQLLPALEHHIVEAGSAPKAVIHIWDTATTGARMPGPPSHREHFTDRGDIWGFKSPRYRTVFHQGECSVNVMDLETGEAVYWVHHPENLPFWTKASPLRSILHWILERDGAQLLHAAVIGYERGAVLLTGKGGVGKSTTALAGLSHGLKYVGDDYVAVRLSPRPCAFSLYCTAKLNAGDIGKFPALAAHVTNVPSIYGEKAVIGLHPHFSAQLVPSMDLRAILAPRVADARDTYFETVDPLAIRRAAAFTTLAQLPYAGQQTQDFVDRLIEALPCFTIRLGHDLERVAGAITGILAETDVDLCRRAKFAPPPAVNSRRASPLISVIVPVYNAADFLAEAIESVLAQNYPCLEILVIDDGSVDDIESAVQRLPVDVRFIRQANRGPAAARNRGLRDASGSIIAFLDVDDQWAPHALQFLTSKLSSDPQLMVAQGAAQVLTKDPTSGRYDLTGDPALAFPSYIGAALYRREVFEKIGQFDDAMRFAEDTDWYIRLQQSGLKFERLDEVTLYVRRHGRNMTLAVSNAVLLKSTIFAVKKAIDRSRRTRSPQR